MLTPDRLKTSLDKYLIKYYRPSSSLDLKGINLDLVLGKKKSNLEKIFSKNITFPSKILCYPILFSSLTSSLAIESQIDNVGLK